MAKRTGKRRAGDAADAFLEDQLRAESERQERAFREEQRQLKRLLELERDRADLAERRLDFALSIQAPVPKAKVHAPTRKANQAAAVVIASDWHVEEVIHPKTVAGRNEYNPAIARKRAERFFANAQRLVELSRSGVTIDTVVVALLGDMITGYIHEELEESNAMSPTEAVLFCIELISAGLEFLADKSGAKRILVPCSFGNHGRTQKRRRVATAAQNSFEWLMYRVLAQRFASDKRIEFLVSDGAHLYVDILGTMVRFHHGDDVRYQGGIGGLHIPLRKALDAWDHFRDADLTVIGHWHQLLFGSDYVVNGSLIGYGPYALAVKARYEPPQQAFFLIDRDHGVTLRAPIRVE